MTLSEFYLVTFLLGVILFLIILLIFCHCIFSCCGRSRKHVDDRGYYQSIQNLVEKQKLIEQQRAERERFRDYLDGVSFFQNLWLKITFLFILFGTVKFV